ncbi:hypothetical protein CBM2599_B140093 [Cupriavidus taiwanensis]|nr:hypothetical protein CBM2599_B140093 [Cupriavidus taiwanensis]SOY99545.1 hypothetical protein CBM2600_B60270 [Cupriavidus taiwanensis]
MNRPKHVSHTRSTVSSSRGRASAAWGSREVVSTGLHPAATAHGEGLRRSPRTRAGGDSIGPAAPGRAVFRGRDQTAKAAPPALANRRRIYCRQRFTPMIAALVRETTPVRNARFQAHLQWLADAARMTYFTRARRPCRRTRRRKCAAAQRLLHAGGAPAVTGATPCPTHYATRFADSPSPAAWALQPAEVVAGATAPVPATLAVQAVEVVEVAAPAATAR